LKTADFKKTNDQKLFYAIFKAKPLNSICNWTSNKIFPEITALANGDMCTVIG